MVLYVIGGGFFVYGWHCCVTGIYKRFGIECPP